MSAWQLWLLTGILLMIAETTAPGFWLLSVAIGCFTAAAVGLLPVGLVIQVLAFAAGTVVSGALLRPILLRHFHRGGTRTNVDALMGKTGVVTMQLGPHGKPGRVLVEGEDWRSASMDDGVLEPGTRVIVLELDGATLKVDREALP